MIDDGGEWWFKGYEKTIRSVCCPANGWVGQCAQPAEDMTESQ